LRYFIAAFGAYELVVQCDAILRNPATKNAPGLIFFYNNHPLPGPVVNSDFQEIAIID
jgi:hypothetical protein